MFLIILATVLAILLSLFITIYIRRRILNYGLPPGPLGLPLLGNLLQMGAKPHLTLSQWAKKFGKLYMINLAHRPTLVVNDQKLIRELLGMMAATGRFKTDVLLLPTNGCFGIANSDGSTWVEQKQFCMRTLKHYGFARRAQIEPLILREVDDLCDWMQTEQSCGRKVYINDKMRQVTTNIIWNILSGERIISHESNIVQLMDKATQDFQTTTQTGVAFFSWIKYLAPVWSGYQGLEKCCKDVLKYVEDSFEKHKTTRIDNEPARDMIDDCIDKVKSCENQNSSFYGELGWKHSLACVSAFLLAGGETTGSTILWIVFYLSAHAKIQERLHEEIDEVIGSKRNPSVLDRLNMPYAEAVILETLRMSSILPYGFIHEVMDDIELQGYRLPKGLLLLTNLYHVHHDIAVWGDPEIFRPERFLEGDEKLRENVVAFQPGRRSCPGEAFAKDIIFLFATKLFQKFSFFIDPEIENKSEYLIPNIGHLLLPQKHPVKITTRI